MEEIKDLIKLAEFNEANIPMLLEAAFKRGMVAGKDIAKLKAIEAIQNER